MQKVLPLKGAKALNALNAFSALLLGLKMLPSYIGIHYEEFYNSFQDRSDEEKESLLRQAVSFVKLDDDEMKSIITFCTDKNNIPYTAVNLNNLDLKELHEIIVAVCMEIGRIRISLVSENEKKKY